MSDFDRCRFVADSPRAKLGLEFQEKVLNELRERSIDAVSTCEWLRSIDPQLVDAQLWMLEKVWGDIVCVQSDGTPLFIECVTASREDTVFPMSKMKFFGKNKWYAFGWNDERHFVPSAQWNAYVKKIETVVKRGPETLVKLQRSRYASMRCGVNGMQKFLGAVSFRTKQN